MNAARISLLFVAVAASVWAFVPRALGAQSPVPAISPAPAVSASSTPAAQATVAIANFAYAPATIAVTPGTRVVFENSDSDAHTVTASDRSFDSGNLDRDKTWAHVFAKAGTYKYFCAYHTYMEGTVVVK